MQEQRRMRYQREGRWLDCAIAAAWSIGVRSSCSDSWNASFEVGRGL